MALLFAVLSMQSGQATSSLSGVRLSSAASEMIVPTTLPHILHVMLNGNDIERVPCATSVAQMSAQKVSLKTLN